MAFMVGGVERWLWDRKWSRKEDLASDEGGDGIKIRERALVLMGGKTVLPRTMKNGE